MGNIPEQSISPVLFIKDGNTRPGQSQSIRFFETINVWKCFVFPGVEDTPTRTTPAIIKIKEQESKKILFRLILNVG